MLKILSENDFDILYDIMLDSFPENERRSYSKQRGLLKKEGFKALTLTDDISGEVRAFITTYEFDTFLFVEHFAVARKYRGLGLGSMILSELQASTEKQLCLEVELPDTDIARRRIDFYLRGGFFFNTYDYIQPPIDDGRAPVPLRIMSTKSPLTKSEFEKIRSILYKNVYNIV